MKIIVKNFKAILMVVCYFYVFLITYIHTHTWTSVIYVGNAVYNRVPDR